MEGPQKYILVFACKQEMMNKMKMSAHFWWGGVGKVPLLSNNGKSEVNCSPLDGEKSPSTPLAVLYSATAQS